jgi:hypothetical protein
MNMVEFCYWLQGYFELARDSRLTRNKLSVIKRYLDQLTGEKIEFIKWLENVCKYVEITNNEAIPIEHFSDTIQFNLSLVFHHVVDDSYEGITREERHRVHEEGLGD